MSANLDLVRSICSAWERGDFDSAEWADPEVEFVRADGPEAGTRRGPLGLAQGTRERLSAWLEYRMIVERYREIDEEHVLALFRLRGRGKTSGLEIEQLGTKGACIFWVRAGKVARLVTYVDGERALADLGLGSDGD